MLKWLIKLCALLIYVKLLMVFGCLLPRVNTTSLLSITRIRLRTPDLKPRYVWAIYSIGEMKCLCCSTRMIWMENASAWLSPLFRYLFLPNSLKNGNQTHNNKSSLLQCHKWLDLRYSWCTFVSDNKHVIYNWPLVVSLK